GEGPEPPYSSFKKAMELSRFPNTYLKIHGLGEILNRPNVLRKDFGPDFFGLVPPLVEMAKEAFGARRMMWGSDYPPVSGREGYRNALAGARDHPAFDTLEEIEWVLGKTALEVIEFV
ncbi:MAG: amidohydrolase family protein, partial [Chloroflexota bacterium]|nr:amidohydrolase family protein [Chloroflexota bacterium]